MTVDLCLFLFNFVHFYFCILKHCDQVNLHSLLSFISDKLTGSLQLWGQYIPQNLLDINTVMTSFLKIDVFTVYLFPSFKSFVYIQNVSLVKKLCSQTVFSIQPEKFSLLIGLFSPFTFGITNGMLGFKSTISISVFYQSLLPFLFLTYFLSSEWITGQNIECKTTEPLGDNTGET